MGWSDPGEGGWGEEKQRLRAVAEGRHSTATDPQLVRQHRSAVCRQSRRHHRLVFGAAAQGPGAERRRKTQHSSAIAAHRLCANLQRQDRARAQKHLSRNGTLNLFAALNVATGHVHHKSTATKTRADFQAFMDDVVNDVASDQEIHVIVDNYATHKKNDDWLTAHPNVTFHFTPTSASWLNQVEIWFGILTRKALNGASFDSTHELAQAIQDFCDAWHQNAHPFVWRKREVKGSQLRNTIYNLLE